MARRKFKYRREDFGDLPVTLHHLNIYLDFQDAHVEAHNTLAMTAAWALDRLELDANSLEIMRVEICLDSERYCLSTFPVCRIAEDTIHEQIGSQLGASEATSFEPLQYEYLEDRNKLIVKLPRLFHAGEKLCIRTITRCFPSDHVLEGIYKDQTPPGAPQQYMSQCQQWGFQRIMPIFDDCRAKCTMRTTIEADAAYTHLISNGNIDRLTNPDGKPAPKPGDPARQIIMYTNPIPMAPYLFLVCVGTWDTLMDQVTYDSGRTARLEYLAPPGRKEGAHIPMAILKEAIAWVNRTQDYEYTADTYRTICMNKSNFGGMENVGNTTIVTDAALIDEHTLDHLLLYAHAVIVHEFEHNQCGSETTMETPFDVWLNEAYTVDVERQFMADRFDADFIRLSQLDSIRNPLLGPLAIEDGGHAGRIVRDGFNDPDELIDGVTYVKAAEVIRMLRLILGPDHFKAGKTLYFSRYRNGNASTDQFFDCFEEVSGRSLEQFKKRWLYTIGYPKVSARTSYNESSSSYRIHFRQDLKPGEAPFHLPVELALVDEKGRDISGTRFTFELKEREEELTLNHIEIPPAFASMNRGCSFYGTFKNEGVTRKTLEMQARLDPDVCSRVDAVRQLTDRQRIRLLLDEAAQIDSDWLTVYGKILGDPGLPASLKAYFLRIDEQPMDREYCTWYPELVVAREKLMGAVNRVYGRELLPQFEQLDTYSGNNWVSTKEGIERRLLKGVLLDLIVIEDSAESHRLILDHFRAATSVTDRVSALAALNRSGSPERLAVLEEAYTRWRHHLTGYANYLRVVSSGTREDVFERIEAEKRRSTFDITQPTWCRALFLPMATNNKVVWTDRGIGWIADTVIELAPINTTTASRLLNTFQHVHKLRTSLREKVQPALEKVARSISGKMSPTIHGQAEAYLRGAQ